MDAFLASAPKVPDPGRYRGSAVSQQAGVLSRPPPALASRLSGEPAIQPACAARRVDRVSRRSAWIVLQLLLASRRLAGPWPRPHFLLTAHRRHNHRGEA